MRLALKDVGMRSVVGNIMPSLVVVDYSCPGLVEEFEQAFGELLQHFVKAGGVVAFPSSEGFIIRSLNKYFGVEWQYSEYYRTTWRPCLDDNESNIIRNFGNGTLSKSVIKNYSAKGSTMRVPKHERCFGERAGRDGGYYVVVAVHDFGVGAIAYFGDVNAEDQTVALVAAFVESRSPTLPIDKLPIDSYSTIESNKQNLDSAPVDDGTSLNILCIEGYCNVPWMESSYANSFFPGDHYSIFRVWCTGRDSVDVPPDAYGVKLCQDEIRSGKYHAIVVMDYSCPDLIAKFERAFGKLLKNFAHAGGLVAVPSSEGLISSTLRKYFDVEWEHNSYYRTTWGPCLEDNESNIYRNFGSGFLSRRVIKEYSAKAVTLRVPKHERCFGVTTSSRTQSLVPFMSGKDKSKQPGDENYDVVVAVHDFGKGVVAYFGDVNAEEQTIDLVAAFVQSRSPKLPIQSTIDSALPGDKVLFQGLKSAADLNGTEGKLLKFIESEQRWSVICFGEPAKKVTAKPENLQMQFE